MKRGKVVVPLLQQGIITEGGKMNNCVMKHHS
jgi:hypothetical protein